MPLEWESRPNSTAGGWSERQGAMWEDKRGCEQAMPDLCTAGRVSRRGRFCFCNNGVSVLALTLALLAGCAINARAAHAQGDWIPELAPTETEHRGRSDAIVILLPGDLDSDTYQRLSLELDALDVTAFATAEPGSLTLIPPEPLSSGPHSLRLVERGEDGSVLERGAWSLDIRHSSLVRDLSLRGDLSGTVNGRVAENGVEVPPEHITGDGAGNVEAAAGDENWRISAQTNFFYNSQLDISPNGRDFDLGEYRIDGDIQNEDLFGGITFGDHDTGIQNFIMSDFYRRGFSARFGTLDERLTVTGFVQSTESHVGTRHVTGVSHEEDRVEGVSVSVRPIEALQDNVVLTGTFYTGEGSDGGFGIGTDEIIRDGTGWSIAADTLWFDEILRVRGEYAQAEFDFDGKDEGFSAETSDAYSVLTSLEPLRGGTLDGEIFTWTVGAEREVVDTFFQSLANPGLVPDRETTSAFTNFYWDEFTADLRVDHTLSNVDDLDYFPTDRTVYVEFNGSYTPFVDLEEDGSLPWYGQPSLYVNANLTEIDRVERSDVFPDEDANGSLRTVTFGIGSNYEDWNWNLYHVVTSSEDHTDIYSDTLDNFTGLSGFFQIGDWLQVMPSVQWDFFNDRDLKDDNQTLTVGLTTNITVIPDTLTAALTYNLNHRMGDGETPDSRSLTGEITWDLREPAANRLGVALILSGFVQENNEDNFDTGPDLQYQAFTSLRLSLPVAY